MRTRQFMASGFILPVGAAVSTEADYLQAMGREKAPISPPPKNTAANSDAHKWPQQT